MANGNFGQQQVSANLVGEMKYCTGCGNQIHKSARSCPNCGAVASGQIGTKSRVTAAILAFFLGGFGAHKFYLGKIGLGFLYLIFFWTFIPAIVAFIEFIIYLTMSDEAFAEKYK
jgi:TM2 domain-containing membrane protein YozV